MHTTIHKLPLKEGKTHTHTHTYTCAHTQGSALDSTLATLQHEAMEPALAVGNESRFRGTVLELEAGSVYALCVRVWVGGCFVWRGATQA